MPIDSHSDPAVEDAEIFEVKEAEDSGIDFSTTTLSIDETSVDSYTGETEIVNWQMYLHILYAELIAFSAICIASVILRNRKLKKQQ